MKLRIFQSKQGDCLLLQSSDGKNILCDGGMAKSMRNQVRDHLPGLVNGNGGKLDVVYVSHIDQDHIQGIEQLLKDALEWRVFDHHQNNNDNDVRPPRFPRPPEIGGLWHNAFRDQVDDNDGEIEDMLAATAPVLFGTSVPEFMEYANDMQNIANSIPQALRVSKYCQADLLDIPVNELPDSTGPARLLFFRDQPVSFNVGSLKVTIVAPSKSALEDLKNGWNTWLSSNEDRVREIREEIQRRVSRFENQELSGSPFDLRDWNGIPDFRGVTAPNVASLVLFVEEDGKTLLLTGDAQQDKILEGLEAANLMPDGHIHLNVLKIPHHGSEHNMDENFAKRVSADHYVFCGNGSSGNPEPEVLRMIHRSRVGSSRFRALSPDADGRIFRFWFSTTSDGPGTNQTNFQETEDVVSELEANSQNRMRSEFTHRNYRTLSL